jgi:N-acetylmuramidase
MSFLSNILDILQAALNRSKSGQDSSIDSSPSNVVEPSIPSPALIKVDETPTVTLPPTPAQPISSKPQWNFVTNNPSKLTEADYQNAANQLGVEIACVKAVTSVESSGGGFFPSGRPKILFEAHLYARSTNQKYNQSNPNISSPKWNRALYAGGEKEYNRLQEAMSLDTPAALLSTSWGLFQIIGRNYKACGFSCVEDFVAAHVESEARQLDAFVKFIKANRMDIHLKNKDWSAFAKAYNGPAFEKNRYHIKMKEAYEKFSK